jgi:hypothetical protein
MKVSQLGNTVGDLLGVEREEGKALVNYLLDNEVIFVAGYDKGSKMAGLTEVDLSERRGRGNGEAAGPKVQDYNVALTEEEIEVAGGIMDFLTDPKRPMQSVESVREIIDAVKPKMSEEAVRRLIRKLDARKMVRILDKDDFSRRGRKGMLLKPKSKDARSNFRSSRKAQLDRLCEPFVPKVRHQQPARRPKH